MLPQLRTSGKRGLMLNLLSAIGVFMLFRRSSKGNTTIGDRTQVEQMLRHLGMVFEQADEGIVVVDREGILHFVNTAWANMHGYETSNELLGKKISVFHTKEQMKTEVIAFIEETQRRGRFTGSLEHVRRDGTTFPTQTKMTVVKDEAGKASALMVFVTDISERKRLEEKLAEADKQREKPKEQIERLQCQITEYEQAEQRLTQQAAELTAANEQLQQQIAERGQAEDGQKEHLDQLEQRVKEQSTELTAANEQLQREIAKREQAEGRLQEYHHQLEQSIERQTAEQGEANERLGREMSKRKQLDEELAATNKRLQHQISTLKQVKQDVREQIAKLTTVSKQLQYKTSEREQSEEVPDGKVEQRDKSSDEIKPLDDDKLKALAEWAKRLV